MRLYVLFFPPWMFLFGDVSWNTLEHLLYIADSLELCLQRGIHFLFLTKAFCFTHTITNCLKWSHEPPCHADVHHVVPVI